MDREGGLGMESLDHPFETAGAFGDGEPLTEAEPYELEGELDDPDELGGDGFNELTGDEFGELEDDEEVSDDFDLESSFDYEADDDDLAELGSGEELGGLDEFDPEGFFGRIGGLFRRAARGLGRIVRAGARALGKIAGPLFRRLAPIAARIVGGAIGGPAGAAIGGTIARAVLRESEVEAAGETEIELARSDEEFAETGGDVEASDAMEFYAAEAAEADEERRADAALIRMAGQAARMFRRNRRLRRVIPRVLRGALALAKTLRANRRTRWAVKTIPLIVRRALTRLSRARRITLRNVVVAMSRETAWVLANRRRAIAALKRHAAARRRVGIRRGGRLRPRRAEFGLHDFEPA